MNTPWNDIRWYVIDHPGDQWTIQDRATGGGACIAKKYGDSSRDHAVLIAAAPRMAEALDGLLAIASKLDVFTHDKALRLEYESAKKTAAAALAAARGDKS